TSLPTIRRLNDFRWPDAEWVLVPFPVPLPLMGPPGTTGGYPGMAPGRIVRPLRFGLEVKAVDRPYQLHRVDLHRIGADHRDLDPVGPGVGEGGTPSRRVGLVHPVEDRCRTAGVEGPEGGGPSLESLIGGEARHHRVAGDVVLLSLGGVG